MSNQPVHKARSGAVKAAVWENEYEIEGKKRKGYSVKLERSYRDKETDEWKDTDCPTSGPMEQFEVFG